MRRFVCFFAAAITIASLSSADTIYLKSGRRIDCERAWEDGKQVKYVVSEGTVGIPRSMVAKIVKAPQTQSAPATQTTESPKAAAQSAPAAVFTPIEKMRLAQKYTTSALAQIDKRDLNGALENLKAAYDLVKTRETVGNLASVYFLLKDDWNASLYLNELLRLDPKNTMALNNLGELAWQKDILDDAQAYWEKSYSIKPDRDIKEKLARLQREKLASGRYSGSSSRHFVMKYDGGTAEQYLVDEISDFLETTYRDLSSKFEEYPNSPFVVILYAQKDYLHATEAPFWSAAVNDGKIRLPIRGLSSMSDELRETLAHELTHSFVNSKTNGNCPVWLQEGLAQRMEGKTLTEEATGRLRKLAQDHSMPKINQLGGSFMNASTNEAADMYVMSFSFTEYLIDRYRFNGMNSLLENLGAGMLFDQAFEGAYMASFSDAEQDWRKSLQN